MKQRWMAILGCLAALAVAASANLLTNPGFETGDFTGWIQTGWYNGGGGDANSGSYGGCYYVAPSVAGGEYYILEQLVAVTAGQIYDASCWMRLAGTANNSEQSMEIQWLDNTGAIMWGNGFATSANSGPMDYTQYLLDDITAPIGAVTASVRAVVHTTDLTTDNAWHTFDDFSFAASIPEPSTVAFMGLGFFACAAYLRQRRRA